MRLTTKGRFAVTAMLDIAVRAEEGPVPLVDVSARQSISVAYLEQLFGKLRRAGLVESTRGPKGGYSLAKPASEISAADIVNVVEENLDATQCGGGSTCHDGAECMTHELWTELNRKLEAVLEDATLEKLARQYRQRVKDAAEGVSRVKIDPELMRRGNR